MAYRQPGVTVTQQFQNALPALATFSLPNVVVGPIFQVLTNASAGAGSYLGTSTTFGYPSFPAGTFVDTRAYDSTDLTSYPVTINLGNAVVTLLTGTAGVVASPNFNTFSDATSNKFAGVLAGDVIVITSGGDAGSYTVRSVTDNNDLQTNETFPTALTGISYTITRVVSSDATPLNIPTSTSGVVVGSTSITLPAALTTTVSPFGTVPIVSAEVLVSYRALSEEQSADLFEIDTIADLQATFGVNQIVPENVAVFGAFLALSNSVTSTNILGLTRDYLLTSELIAYGNAFTILALNDIYAISVMTQNTSVHTALQAHVDGLSTPAEKLERVGIINRQLVTITSVTTGVTDATVDSTGLIIGSASSHFLTDGVVPGDYVEITAGATVGRYLIASVASQTSLTLTNASPAPISGGPLTGVSLYIDRNLQLSEQASVLAAYASTLADRRLVMTWPDIVSIPVGNTIRQLPGYFLNPAVGALTTGLPTQQGLTNLDVAVYSGVVHSTKYFTNDQLNTIAGGGVMIFVQSVLNQTPLFIRHQLTTDTSAIKFQEYSVTKNVDFIAKFIRQQHAPFIGQYNIVQATFDDLKTEANGILSYLTNNTRLPKIGGVISGGTLTSIVQDPANIDGILETWTLSIPIPLNNLDITIVV